MTWVQFWLGAMYGLNLLLVLALLLLFFAECSSFLPPENPTFPNSDSTQIEDPHENQLWLMWHSVNIAIFTGGSAA